ncbi:tetraspanin 96F [Lycorma delicatula]|uniref:tetraspanin 96F n=1 Tax=Lycorma delicatula TaxID=130591 RepID=UPI003F513F38
MGLAGCYAILKYLIFIVNLIFWICGLVIIVLSLWMMTNTSYFSMTQDESNYYSGLYLFLTIGILMFVVGLLGCFGTIKKSQCLLVLFFCFLLVILVAEISAAAWAYSNSDDLEKLVKQNVEETVLKEYGNITSRTETFDVIQRELNCCGAKGPTDWLSSSFNKVEKQRVDLAISASHQTYKIPASCCKPDKCTKTQVYDIVGHFSDKIYTEGCSEKLLVQLKNSSGVFIGVGVFISICQILGLIFSLILCCGFQQQDRYKA